MSFHGSVLGPFTKHLFLHGGGGILLNFPKGTPAKDRDWYPIVIATHELDDNCESVIAFWTPSVYLDTIGRGLSKSTPWDLDWNSGSRGFRRLIKESTVYLKESILAAPDKLSESYWLLARYWAEVKAYNGEIIDRDGVIKLHKYLKRQGVVCMLEDGIDLPLSVTLTGVDDA